MYSKIMSHIAMYAYTYFYITLNQKFLSQTSLISINIWSSMPSSCICISWHQSTLGVHQIILLFVRNRVSELIIHKYFCRHLSMNTLNQWCFMNVGEIPFNHSMYNINTYVTIKIPEASSITTRAMVHLKRNAFCPTVIIHIICARSNLCFVKYRRNKWLLFVKSTEQIQNVASTLFTFLAMSNHYWKKKEYSDILLLSVFCLFLWEICIWPRVICKKRM